MAITICDDDAECLERNRVSTIIKKVNVGGPKEKLGNSTALIVISKRNSAIGNRDKLRSTKSGLDSG